MTKLAMAIIDASFGCLDDDPTLDEAVELLGDDAKALGDIIKQALEDTHYEAMPIPAILYCYNHDEIDADEAMDLIEDQLDGRQMTRAEVEDQVKEIIETMSCEEREKIRDDDVAKREMFNDLADSLAKDGVLHPFIVNHMDNPF